MRMYFKPIGAENQHRIKMDSDGLFRLLMQHAALLSLKEAGFLTVMEHWQAESILTHQYRERIRINTVSPNDD